MLKYKTAAVIYNNMDTNHSVELITDIKEEEHNVHIGDANRRT
jgi:hypothetical protein